MSTCSPSGFFNDLIHFRVPTVRGNSGSCMLVLNFIPFLYGVGTIWAGFQTRNLNAKIIGGLQWFFSFLFIGIPWSIASGILIARNASAGTYYALGSEDERSLEAPAPAPAPASASASSGGARDDEF